MFNYRKQHKEKIKVIIDSIEFEKNNLDLRLEYITSGQQDPYIFIQNGSISVDKEGNQGQLYDSDTLFYTYRYAIISAFRFYEGEIDGTQSDRRQVLDSLIIAQLTKEIVALDFNSNYTGKYSEYQNYAQWNELRLVNVSLPEDSEDTQIVDNTLFTIYEIEIDQLIQLSRSRSLPININSDL